MPEPQTIICVCGYITVIILFLINIFKLTIKDDNPSDISANILPDNTCNIIMYLSDDSDSTAVTKIIGNTLVEDTRLTNTYQSEIRYSLGVGMIKVQFHIQPIDSDNLTELTKDIYYKVRNKIENTENGRFRYPNNEIICRPYAKSKGIELLQEIPVYS